VNWKSKWGKKRRFWVSRGLAALTFCGGGGGGGVQGAGEVVQCDGAMDAPATVGPLNKAGRINSKKVRRGKKLHGK